MNFDGRFLATSFFMFTPLRYLLMMITAILELMINDILMVPYPFSWWCITLRYHSFKGSFYITILLWLPCAEHFNGEIFVRHNRIKVLLLVPYSILMSGHNLYVCLYIICLSISLPTPYTIFLMLVLKLLNV
jgi:hypothetical protein